MKSLDPKPPITNTHSHVFTHNYVPPYLAKTIIPWPFYYLIHLPTFVRIYVFFKLIQEKRFKPFYRKVQRLKNEILRFIHRVILLKLILFLIVFYIGLVAFLTLFNLLVANLPVVDIDWSQRVVFIRDWLYEYHLLITRPNWLPHWLGIVLTFIFILVVPSVRKISFFLLNLIWRFFHLLPSSEIKQLLGRYLMMARFAIYKKQGGIANKLKHQYPIGTHFYLLSMDMEFMKAGRIKNKYNFKNQLLELEKLNDKKEFHAFIFIDPRRITKEGKSFFDFEIRNDKVVLKDCLIKDFIENKGFVGFKIYPALGYFPFDERLLVLWKYAAENKLPIISHGIKGSIYYRGKLQKDWTYHPVFNESFGSNELRPLLFPETKNVDFQINFTHPLNYLCLLEEPLLRILIAKSKNQDLKNIFGFENQHTELRSNLSQLKISFAHFGGAEEWAKYLERDRDIYAQQLMTKGVEAINLKIDDANDIPWRRYEHLWKYTDWYSICCSLMIHYNNFYADISYLVSKPSFYPLLKQTISKASSYENKEGIQPTYLTKEILRTKVLFGSDFYVVRSQKADKDIFLQLKSYLSEEEFDLITRLNPQEFIRNK